mmetsp:Transcript_25296/g.72938  ORF Transcript_25296/g.72938 Transcript_25296/m.72938 type:complete len:237 (-) Transcript_25296:605-1315(-)
MTGMEAPSSVSPDEHHGPWRSRHWKLWERHWPPKPNGRRHGDVFSAPPDFSRQVRWRPRLRSPISTSVQGFSFSHSATLRRPTEVIRCQLGGAPSPVSRDTAEIHLWTARRYSRSVCGPVSTPQRHQRPHMTSNSWMWPWRLWTLLPTASRGHEGGAQAVVVPGQMASKGGVLRWQGESSDPGQFWHPCSAARGNWGMPAKSWMPPPTCSTWCPRSQHLRLQPPGPIPAPSGRWPR